MSGEPILGYEAPIHRALWERILTCGVPRLWFIAWVAGCVFAAFSVYSLFRHWLAMMPLAVCVIGHMALKALTWWDSDWDAVLAHSLRYRSYYEAG
jgi:type IV secretory pathway TrbD component